MRSLILLPVLLVASPTLAQTPLPPPAPVPQDVQRVLNDPAMADRLTNVMQAMSKAFMDLPVGQIEAAVEGRPATAAERRETLGQVARRDGIDVQRQIAQSRPMIRQSMRALSDALPGMINGLKQAQESIERAAANMPDPTYPKR